MRSDGLLDVWLLQVPRDKASADRLARSELDDRERARAASFRREPDALLYVCAHIALRRILGSYLGIGPRDVRLARAPCGTCGAPHGRPTVEAPSPGLHFSLSHSGGMALVAVASSTVGADVQLLPAVRTVVECLPALHPQERLELRRLPSQTVSEAFGQLWTRKEAYLKGIGTGLSRSPSLDYLGSDSRRRPEGWTFADIACGPHHRAAVAVLGEAPAASIRRLPMDRLLAEPTATHLVKE